MINKAIGGYFELELSNYTNENNHSFIELNSARNCLEYILTAKKYTKVYIAYYTCDVILEPIRKLNIPYDFYDIDVNLEPIFDYSDIKETEAFLYTNYFGIKNMFTKGLAEKIGKNIIIDNAQALFAPVIENVDSFFSPRKFVGVADGGYLYTNKRLATNFDKDESYNRMSHLFKRIDLSAEEGYHDFSENDHALSNQPIKLMSNLTKRILASIDYDSLKKRRRENFLALHKVLESKNLFKFELDADSVPLVYPFRTVKEGLKNKLIADRIYCATYWPNVFDWADRDKNAYLFAKELVAIPVDQRYGIEDMQHILNVMNDV